MRRVLPAAAAFLLMVGAAISGPLPEDQEVDGALEQVVPEDTQPNIEVIRNRRSAQPAGEFVSASGAS